MSPDAHPSGETPRFVVTCDDCEACHRLDDVDEAVTFAVEHRRHTGHSLTWERSVLPDEVDVETQTEWRVRCERCETTRVFRDEATAEQFYDDHEQYAGHPPTEVASVELVDVDPAQLEAALDYCFEAVDSVDVVPVGFVLEAFAEAGASTRRVSRKLAVVESETDIYERGGGLLARA